MPCASKPTAHFCTFLRPCKNTDAAYASDATQISCGFRRVDISKYACGAYALAKKAYSRYNANADVLLPAKARPKAYVTKAQLNKIAITADVGKVYKLAL